MGDRESESHQYSILSPAASSEAAETETKAAGGYGIYSYFENNDMLYNTEYFECTD